MIYFKLLGPIFVLVVAIINIALQQKWRGWHDGGTKVHKRVVSILLILMVVGMVITCIVVWREAKSSNLHASKVESLLNSITNLEHQLEFRSQEIIALSQANATLTEEVSRSIIGGNSFCYFLHSFPVGTTNTVMRMLRHVGKYPLHDLHIRIVDGNRYRELFARAGIPLLANEIENTQTRIHKPTFFKQGQGNASLDLEYLELPGDEDYQKFSIFFNADNGEWHQQVSLRRVGHEWKLATRVTNAHTKTLLIPEKISAEFPRDENGKLMW